MADSPPAARPSPAIDGLAMHTSQLLSEFAKLINRFGPDSQEADEFLRRHGENNQEFYELARLSAVLKRALSVGRVMPDPSRETAENS